MNIININISRDDVLEEVAKATDYVGAKTIPTEQEADPRERIFATDYNLEDLHRLWVESVVAIEEWLKELLTESSPMDDGHSFKIEVSAGFDPVLTPSVEKAIRSYFVANILAGWFKFANKAEAPDYSEQAVEFLAGAERLLYSRRRPTLRLTHDP
ncbi:MAG: hypothetical protein HDT09_02250 [Bacteroidales bacterium]|nr:hypothetical protein [Bacteroidales bacterium]